MGTWRSYGARPNPVWRTAAEAEVLVVFQNAQAYIRPSWCPTRSDSGKVVPTWNDVMVQARGTLSVHDDHDLGRTATEWPTGSWQPTPRC